MASSKPRRLHSEMVDALSCIICYLPYDVKIRLPKVFPCQHTVCLSCANELCQQQEDGNVFPCPTCRQPVTIPERGAAGLQTNLDVTNMVEIINKTKDISVATPDCPNHPSKPMTNICMTCKVGLCGRCFTSAAMQAHTGHAILDIDDAFEEVKATCDDLVQRGNEMSVSLRKLARESQDKYSLIESTSTAMVSAQESKNVGVFELMQKLTALLEQPSASKEIQDSDTDVTSGIAKDELTDDSITELANKRALEGLSHGKSELDKYERAFASDSVVCTKLAAASVLVDVLRLQLHRNETKSDGISDILNHLWNLTDDSAPSCERVVLLGGATLLLKCFKTNMLVPDISSKVVGVFANLARVNSHHTKLLSPMVVNMLSYCVQNFTMSQHNIPALSCDAMSSFLCNKDATWPQGGCLSRAEVSQLVMNTCEEFPLNETLSYQANSFRTEVFFLSQEVSTAAKYWAVLALHAFTYDHPSKYCPMLVRDGVVPVLSKQQNSSHNFIKKLSKKILVRVSKYE